MNWIPCSVDFCKSNLNGYCNNEYPPDHEFIVEGGKRREFGHAVCTSFKDKEDK